MLASRLGQRRRERQQGRDGRAFPLAAAILLLAAIAGLYEGGSPGVWQLVLFGLGPDVALLLGLQRGLEPGRLAPRAVPLYNALHRPLLPLAMAVAVALGALPGILIAGALTWGLHIAIDRSLGFGLRRRDGRRR